MKKIFTGREAVPYKAYQSLTPKHQKTSEDIRVGFHLLMLEAFELGSSVLQLWQLIGPAYPCSVSS